MMRGARGTYVGYTREPCRRLRQHNGLLPGGAAPRAGRPWQLVLVVSGFASRTAALEFESAWQRPHASRLVSRVWNAMGFGRCSGSTSVRVRLEALCVLLEHEHWMARPLAMHVLCRVAPAWRDVLERAHTMLV